MTYTRGYLNDQINDNRIYLKKFSKLYIKLIQANKKTWKFLAVQI